MARTPFPIFEERLDATGRENAYRFLRQNQHTATQFTVLWLECELERLGAYIVAKKEAKTGQKAVEFPKADWKGFADCSLSDNDKVAIRASHLSADDLFEGMLQLLATGHKASISHSPITGQVTVSITGHYAFCENAGMTLTSTGKDITTAWTVALYKHFTKLKEKWGEASYSPDDDMS